MKYNKFEDYLMTQCIEETHCLDDESPDVYEAWLSDLSIETIISMADVYGTEKKIEGLERGKEIMNDVLRSIK